MVPCAHRPIIVRCHVSKSTCGLKNGMEKEGSVLTLSCYHTSVMLCVAAPEMLVDSTGLDKELCIR